MAIVRKSTRNLAIANRLRVSCAHKITKVSSSLAEMTFKGHSRSSEMSWFDRLHVICYYRSIVTMARLLVSFPTLYSQMLVENRTIYNPNCIQYINITGQHCCTTCGKSDQSNSKYRKKVSVIANAQRSGIDWQWLWDYAIQFARCRTCTGRVARFVVPITIYI